MLRSEWSITATTGIEKRKVFVDRPIELRPPLSPCNQREGAMPPSSARLVRSRIQQYSPAPPQARCWTSRSRYPRARGPSPQRLSRPVRARVHPSTSSASASGAQKQAAQSAEHGSACTPLQEYDTRARRANSWAPRSWHWPVTDIRPNRCASTLPTLAERLRLHSARSYEAQTCFMPCSSIGHRLIVTGKAVQRERKQQSYTGLRSLLTRDSCI